MWEVNRKVEVDNSKLVEQLAELEQKLMEVELTAEAPYWIGVKADIDNARIDKIAIKKRIDKIKKELSGD